MLGWGLSEAARAVDGSGRQRHGGLSRYGGGGGGRRPSELGVAATGEGVEVGRLGWQRAVVGSGSGR